MYQMCLVNMPFAALYLPSLALTQLKSVTEEKLGNEVSIKIAYLNHDFARFIGIELYNTIANSVDAHTTGIGDWLFRQVAFPSAEDNTAEYFRRYFPRGDQETQKAKQRIMEIRQRLPEFFDLMIEKYDLDQVDLVGLTSMFTQNIACLALAEVVKRTNPNAITVMGGANCEFPMGQELVKNARQIDFVFSGPALINFPAFVQYRLNQEFDKCHSIRGVFSRRNSLLSVLDSKGEMGEELPIDVAIDLNYESFLNVMRETFPKDGLSPVLLFETSRGCWWGEKSHCTFCGLNGSSMGYRAMSPEKALSQFDQLFRYSDSCDRFDAVDNILPKSYLQDVLPYLNPPLNAKIFYEVKADLSEEDMQVLSRAGVRSVQPGIESLATSTLKLMRKGTSAFINITLLKNCITYSIFPYWNLLIGFPKECEDVYQKYYLDLPLLVHLPPPSGTFPVRFDRYSPYFVKAQEYELDLHPLQYYRLAYPFGEMALNNMAYYFADSNLKARYMMDVAKWIGKLRERVEAWKQSWHQDMSRRPKLYFIKRGETTVIFDSRGQEEKEYSISQSDLELLEFLNKPRRGEDLLTKLNRTPAEAEAQLSSLKKMGLLFQEGERYLSLVLPGAPPPISLK